MSCRVGAKQDGREEKEEGGEGEDRREGQTERERQRTKGQIVAERTYESVMG